MVNVIDNNVQKLFDISCWGDAVFPFMECVADHGNSYKSFDWLQFPRKVMKRVKYALHTISMTQCVLTALPWLIAPPLPAVCTRVQQLSTIISELHFPWCVLHCWDMMMKITAVLFVQCRKDFWTNILVMIKNTYPSLILGRTTVGFPQVPSSCQPWCFPESRLLKARNHFTSSSCYKWEFGQTVCVWGACTSVDRWKRPLWFLQDSFLVISQWSTWMLTLSDP